MARCYLGFEQTNKLSEGNCWFTGAFENEDQATEFVRCKIESMVANKVSDHVDDEETKSFKTATRKFMKLFNMPREEKLVNRTFIVDFF